MKGPDGIATTNKNAHAKRARGRPPSLSNGARDVVLLVTGLQAKWEGRSEREAVRSLLPWWPCPGKRPWSEASLWRHYQRLRAPRNDPLRTARPWTAGMRAALELSVQTLDAEGGGRKD